MANVRKLPKLCSKRKILSDIFGGESKLNSSPTSPCKHLKCSPVNKSTDRILFINGGGQLKLSIYVNCGLLTVEVLEGRHFSSKWKTVCSSYVKLSLVPDDNRRSRCKTNIIQETNHPTFKGKFSFELLDGDHDKRLLISAWHKDEERKSSEFLGCMSFGIKSIVSSSKTVSGWYYLLTEDVGRKKHLQATSFHPQLKLTERSHRNVPETTTKVKPNEPELITLLIKRGRNGFGFSMVRSGSLKVKEVDEGSHAQHAGLQIGDNIIRLNGHDVSKSSAESVAKSIKHSSKTIVMDVLRPVVVEHHTSCKQQLPLSENKENIGPDNAAVVKKKSSSMNSLHVFQAERTGAIQQIMDCEEKYISDMQHGIQNYSRPLRHRILTPHQHQAIFQNVEKLVALSEFILRQLTDIATGNSKGEVGKVYRSKIDFLCEAHETYFRGYQNASLMLTQLRGYSELEHFLQENAGAGEQMSVAAFIQQPTFHLVDLLRNMQMLLSWTPANHPDHTDLTQVAQALQKSCDTIHQNAPSPTHWKGSSASLESTSSADFYSSSAASSRASSSSHLSLSSIDGEVLDLQQRVLWAENLHPITLATRSRHVIYTGELICVEEKATKVWAILFSDLLLLTKAEPNGQFTVIYEPVYMHEISHKNFCQQNGTEFSLTVGMYEQASHVLTLRAPSVDQKTVWKSIIEHRLSSTQFMRETDLFLCRNGDHVEDFGVL